MSLISLLVTSCLVGPKVKRTHIANWSTCAKDGTYIEMYFTDSILIFQQAKGFHQSFIYEIKENTLMYFKSNLKNKLKDTVKLIVTEVNDRSMIFESVNPYEKWEFKKIIGRVKLPILVNHDLRSLRQYDEEKRIFFARASKFKCVDKRSAAEIAKDSLDRNSFKF